MTSVVVIDDSMLIRRELSKYFESEMGYNVIGLGSDGTEAIELYKLHKPDLMTLDITMPNKDGIEALREILAFDSNAKVVMVSAIKDSDKILQALQIGAKAYIKKPLQFKKPEFVNQLKDDLFQIMNGLAVTGS